MARPAPSSDVEEQTQAIGRDVFSRLHEVEHPIVDSAWWEEKILEFCMEHPELKVQLFRFIDVLPALRPRAVTEHLLEYLGHARGALPALLRWSVDVPAPRGAVGRLIARAARQNVLRMARRFIAGSTTGEAVAAIRRLRRNRLAVTLDVLGEAVISEREADLYLEQYLTLLRETTRTVARWGEDPLIDRDYDGTPLPRVNVSLKLSALTALFDPIDPDGVRRAVVPRLETVLDAAAEAGAFVHVDMEHYDIKDLTLSLFKEVLGAPKYRARTDVGIVLQAYLRDCERDLIDLADWSKRRGTPVWVRLVKGAYWDSETVVAAQRRWPVPVFEHKWETDRNFERCTDVLLDLHGALRPAFASHNVRSLAHALASARARGLPERFIELQTLYGMADPLKLALVDLDQRVRVYTPYGDLIPGMAYLVRRLLENTSNESFLRHQIVEHSRIDDLLGAPAPAGLPLRAEDSMPTVKPEPKAQEPLSAEFANEPLQDFANASVRERVARAIQDVERRLIAECPLVIDGQAVHTRDIIESRSPSDTRRVVGKSAAAGPVEADRAVAAARAGFAEWRRVPVEERARILERTAELLGERRNELCGWICLEAGKPWRDADADVAEAMDFCRFYAKAMLHLARPRKWPVPGEDNASFYAPRGVATVISPWNFPLAILCGMTAAPLVAGNTVVMKPAEQTPIVGYQLYLAFRDAGVPAHSLHFLPGYGETAGALLVEHPDVATIAFTGSRDVGHLIARRAAETSTGRAGLKRVVAEMGGKNAVIVDDDADLDEAVPGVLASAFGYGGQKCSACSRVIAVGRIYEPFSKRLVEAAGALVVGPAEDPATAVGPLIEAEAVQRVRRYLELAERTGKLLFRGEMPPLEHGHFVSPAIVADLPPDSPILRDEIFGPLLAVVRAESFDHALAIANDTDYALTGGLYSRSPEHISRARVELEVGNLYVNRKITGALVGRQPFGGFRHSGTGRQAGGADYLLEFLVERTVAENTLRRGFAPTE